MQEWREHRVILEQWRGLFVQYLDGPSSSAYDAQPVRAELLAQAPAAGSALAAAESGVAVQQRTGSFDHSLVAVLDALDRIGPRAHAQALQMEYGSTDGSIAPAQPGSNARREAGQQLLGMLDRSIERLRERDGLGRPTS
jgi:hypothetical protein